MYFTNTDLDLIFSHYANGYGRRSIYINGPLGGIYHAFLVHSFLRKQSKINHLKIGIVLSLTQKKRFDVLPTPFKCVDLSYQSLKASKLIFDYTSILTFFPYVLYFVLATFPLRKRLLIESPISLIAAGSLVAAGKSLSEYITITNPNKICWLSDHCIIARSAIFHSPTNVKHTLLCHGQSIGETNKYISRAIFRRIYVTNALQLKVLSLWTPDIPVILIKAESTSKDLKKILINIPTMKSRKKRYLFLNQLDLGLANNNQISRELFDYISQSSPLSGFNIVVKNKEQLKIFSNKYPVTSFCFGVNEFTSKVSPFDATCVVFSSGVSVDLILQNYKVLISSQNPLMTDDMARQVLEPVLHTSSENSTINLYRVKYTFNTSL